MVISDAKAFFTPAVEFFAEGAAVAMRATNGIGTLIGATTRKAMLVAAVGFATTVSGAPFQIEEAAVSDGVVVTSVVSAERSANTCEPIVEADPYMLDSADLIPSGPTVREMALASLSIPMGEFVDDLL